MQAYFSAGEGVTQRCTPGYAVMFDPINPGRLPRTASHLAGTPCPLARFKMGTDDDAYAALLAIPAEDDCPDGT